MWRWWRGGDELHHVTINLAIAGSLLLLPALGPGRFSVDHMMKKQE